ncbi:MAG: F0F1 ATP synthase subunit B [Planctomycetota bacterium]|jgi:F-type H+-transporting ATPase subunit b
MRSFSKAAAALVAAATGFPTWASEGGAGGAALLTPKWGTMFWTAVTFLALVWLLGRFAWKPLLGAIDAREQSIRDSFDRASKDQDEAASLLGQHRELLAAARRERAEAVDQGKRDAEKVKAEILEEAKRQREQVLKETQSQVDVGLRKARSDLRSTAVDLAILAAEKLLTKNLDDPTQRRLVEEHLSELERRSGDSPLPS